MFTGIIESLGIVESIEKEGSNISFWVKSSISNELKIDQSVSHNGVCLTVVALQENSHRVTAIEETLRKTNLQEWQEGTLVNLERCMVLNGRLDGHIVQGHADTTAVCIHQKTLAGSWEFTFQFPEKFAALLIEKGSVTVNGISLTCFNITNNQFSVAIIPYTFQHTNLQAVAQSHLVNIEFDMIGKYINRFNQLQQHS